MARQQPLPQSDSDFEGLSFWQRNPKNTTAGIMATANLVAAAVTVPSLMKDAQTAEATKHFLLSDSILGKDIPNVVTLAVVALIVEVAATALVYLSVSPPKNPSSTEIHDDEMTDPLINKTTTTTINTTTTTPGPG